MTKQVLPLKIPIKQKKYILTRFKKSKNPQLMKKYYVVELKALGTSHGGG